MSKYYILRGHEVFEEPDLLTWAKQADHTVKQEYVSYTHRFIFKKSCRVSTIFLGLDHNYGKGPPLLFETMIFGGPLDQEQDRYSTWDEALTGHEKMKQRALKG